MKFLILFLFCGVFCELPVPSELPVSTVLPVLEPETLTDLPRELAEDFGGVVGQNRDNDLVSNFEIEVGGDEVETDGPIAAVPEGPSDGITQSSVSTTTAHFLENACTEANMEWNTCGPRCYQTCAFQPRGVRRSRAVCEVATTASGCFTGCFCKKGYVRLNKKCVLSADCPTRTCIFSNEEYKQCGTPCPITCDSSNHADEIMARCPTEICVRGCFCKPGYVRSTTGLCVLPTRCPRPLVV